MSNEEFENYLALVSRLLRLSPGQRNQIGEELRDHLETRTAELVESGVERTAAVKQAIEEFGDVAAFAKNFRSVSVQNRKRWMMRFATVCTAVAFLVVVLAMATWPDGARFGTPSYSTALDETAKPEVVDKSVAQPYRPSSKTEANEAIRRTLRQPCVLDYQDEAISDVMADLESKLNLNIVLTPSARDDSLDVDEPITVNVRGIPFSDALNIMLAEKNATYCVQDGVLKLISIDDAVSDPVFSARRMVNVNNLLTFIRKKEASRIGKPVSATNHFSNGDGSGGGGGGVFSYPAAGPNEKNEQSEANDTRSEITKLTEAILSLQQAAAEQQPVRLTTAESILIGVTQAAVQTDSWLDMGSGVGQIKIIGGIMILVTTEKINDEVESFLIDLEYAMQTDSNPVFQASSIQEPAPKPAVDSSNSQPSSDDMNPFAD